MQSRLLFAVLAATFPAAALGSALAAQSTADQPPTAPRGAYTEAQAARGEATYRANCTSCHATSAYVGDAFVRAWDGRTAFDIFELIRTTMPNDNPGRLSREEYAAVVAYLFKLNRLPAGDRPLPSDDDGLKQVRIDARSIPAP